MRFDVRKVPDDHPGWGRLLTHARKVWERHPEGHDCHVCDEARRPVDPAEVEDDAPFWQAKVA